MNGAMEEENCELCKRLRAIHEGNSRNSARAHYAMRNAITLLQSAAEMRNFAAATSIIEVNKIIVGA